MKLIKTIKNNQVTYTHEWDTTEMFLDYVNNFISFSAWCEHYGISQQLGRVIINSERALNDIIHDYRNELNVTL